MVAAWPRNFANQKRSAGSVWPLQLNPASFSDHRPDEAEPRAVVVRLIRRVCVLREQGNSAEAERLRREELERAVSEYRRVAGTEALPDPGLEALFAMEEQRVAEAAILGELLLPRLLAAWPGREPPGPAKPVARRPSVSTAPSAAPAGPPVIADLLDAMLAAERPGRPSAAAPRES